MKKEELKDYLVNHCDYSREQVEQMDSYDLFDAILKWEGFIGDTDDIIKWYKAAFQKTEA